MKEKIFLNDKHNLTNNAVEITNGLIGQIIKNEKCIVRKKIHREIFKNS